jgi:hypothetical protein
MVYPSLQRRVHLDVLRVSPGYSCNVSILVYAYSFDAVWETEMKCHDSWRNVFLSSTMINKMLDK